MKRVLGVKGKGVRPFALRLPFGLRARRVTAARLQSLLYILCLCIAGCAGGGEVKGGTGERVAVAGAALTSSITVSPTKAGHINQSKNPAGCAATYAVVANNSQVGGGATIAICGGNEVLRNYFYFDLSGITHAAVTTPTSANFSTTGGGNAGSYPRTITFRRYSGDPTSGTLSTNFGNLLSGSSYGTVNITSSSAPNPVSLALAGTSLADIQAALGAAAFAIGGTYSSEGTVNRYGLNVAPTATLALSLTCDSGYADCNAGTDGCEKPINTDAACGTTCATAACTTNQTCSSGACATCAAGTQDCDTSAANGCEKASTDASCGCANTVCTTSQTCTSGACAACAAGVRDCDSSAANGCEKPINTDASCGTTCATVACTTNQTCTAGACAACGAGTLDCDTNAANGCEKPISTDASCGTTCATAACTTSQTCTAGACAACTAGNLDCDGSAANGCEKTNTDANCGCANTACTTSQTCNTTTGVCGACGAGTRDCDGSAANGCEKPINTDASCGTTCATAACTTSQTCTAGACAVCAAGVLDCDGNAANGCEKTNTDASCGCANTVCTTGQTCNTTTGVCGACAAGTLDCDGNAANACERVTNSVASCGTTCANTVSCDDSNVCSTDACSAGACTHVAGSAGVVCRASLGVCDPVAETCTGSSINCPADTFAPSTTVCRYQSNICDALEYCTGSASSCPGDAYAAVGADCGYTTGSVSIYSSGLPANSLDSSAAFTSQSLTNAGPNATWTNALKFTATATATVTATRSDYWKISTTAHTFLSSDLIEYDVYLADNKSEIGGIDVATSSGYLRTAPAIDQNGLSSNPTADISARAFGQWYHRRFAVSGLSIVGQSSTKWDVVDENNTASAAYTAYYDNLIVAAKQGACDGADVCKIKDDESCALASDCATGFCLGSVCGPPRADGIACTSDTQCISSFCVDSRCCSSACAGGTTDCQACSIAAGATTNGTCGTASSSTVCRPSVGSCDLAEQCTGSSTTCPADTQ